ncbi:hypothetical protein A2U01_0073818, partial [Trifolium medium]|nr:hypothetical protein [Trifolium medium]
FPADTTVSTPCCIAWNAPTEIESPKWTLLIFDSVPIDTDNISTPSAIASSNAVRILESGQPIVQHTLYTAMRADGAPVEVVKD